jgi:hypothetical protein
LAATLLFTLGVIVLFLLHLLPLNLTILNSPQCFEQLVDLTEKILKFFGLLLMLITLFEFYRRVSEYLPQPRPNPRSLLASFGFVVTTSLMSSILIFSHLQELTKNVGNLISVGVVMGIGVAALIFVYKHIPHVLSKMWVFAEMRFFNNFGIMGGEIDGFVEFLIRLKEEKEDRKAVKIKVFIPEPGQIERDSLKVYLGAVELINVHITRSSFYWIAEIQKSEILRYNFRFNVTSLRNRKISIHIEDENGRDITMEEDIYVRLPPAQFVLNLA